MTINSELLKSSIADAKAVRATALANAKASLEEHFAPRFEALFAEKLKGDTEEETETLDEVEAPNQVSGKGGEAKGPATKAVTKGNPKKVSDGASNYKTVAVGGAEGAKGSNAPAANQSIMNETEEDEESEKVEENVGLTTEDLDEIIAELESEVGDEQPAQEPAPAPAPEGDPSLGLDGSAPAPMPTTEPSLDGSEVPAPAPAPVAPQIPGQQPVDGQAPAEDEINLEELLAALNEEADADEEEVSEGKLPPWLKKGDKKGDKKDDKKDDTEELDEITNNGVPTNVGGQDKHDSKLGYSKSPQDASKKQINGKNHGGDIGDGAVSGKPKLEEGKYKVALKEAYDTISYLRGQINEVNLLNAKLLYTNKLFKEFSDVLDDSYRMKIVENFDLTKSVREVKLAYALLTESLNFGTKSSNSNKQVSQKPVQKKLVTQIAEGLASKTVASTKPSKELISEGNEMALRFKKLAGIKEAPKNK